MHIVRSQLLLGDPVHGGRAMLALVSDVAGHRVRIRSNAPGMRTRSRDGYCGLILAEARESFDAALRTESRTLGRGARRREADAVMERWLDHLASAGELPSPGRPRPRRSVACPAAVPTVASAPASVAWQSYPIGIRATLILPSAGAPVFALWSEGGERVVEAVSATSRHEASALLARAGRLTRASTIEGVLSPDADAFFALDLVRYGGEDLTNRPAATRAALLEQIWSGLGAEAGVRDGWIRLALVGDRDSLSPGYLATWRNLEAGYGIPDSWGFEAQP